MNAYSAGLELHPVKTRSYWVGAEGPLVATPGYIRDQANALNAEIESMDTELGTERSSWGLTALPIDKQKMDQWWNSTWVPFFSSWRKWWEDHGNSGTLGTVMSNFWGSSWTELQTWRQKFINTRESAKAVGYNFTSPEPAAPDESPWKSGIMELWDTIKLVIYAGIFLLGGWMLLQFRQ